MNIRSVHVPVDSADRLQCIRTVSISGPIMERRDIALALACASVGWCLTTLFGHKRRLIRRAMAQAAAQSLRDLPANVPVQLTVQHYFDLEAAEKRGYPHATYLRDAQHVGTALDGLHDYIVKKLSEHASIFLGADMLADLPSSTSLVGLVAVSANRPSVLSPERIIGSNSCDKPPASLMICESAAIQGGVFDTSNGPILIGAAACIEPGAFIRGPAVIGERCTVRRGAYIRGDVILGAGSIVGCEMKMALTLDSVELPHTGYVGDSLLGHRAHFGCSVVTANFPLFANSLPKVHINGMRYALGRRKFGAVLGDGSQLGCGCVTEPGCLIGKNVHAYPLCRLPNGIYGPDALLKNRPSIEEAPFDRSR